jgi:hypothetical protein
MKHLVMHQARDGSDLALTIDECVLLDHLRDGTPYIPAAKFPLIEAALERLGHLSLERSERL